MSKKNRSFMIILSTLFFILVSVVPIYAESSSVYGSSVSSNETRFLTPSTDVLIFGSIFTSGNLDYLFDYSVSLNPVFSLDPVSDIGQVDEAHTEFLSGYGVSSMSYYEDFFVDDLYFDSDLGNFYGSTGCYFSSEISFLRSDSSVNLASDGFGISINDFYCWTEDDFHNQESEVVLSIDTDNTPDVSFSYAEIYYSLPGESEVQYLFVDVDDYNRFDRLNFDIDAHELFGVPDVPGTYVYIHSATYYLDCYYSSNLDLYGYLSYEYDDYRKYDLDTLRGFDSDNPAIPLLDYTRWLGSAVSGFLDLQIFPYFTIGGILMTLIAFSCVIWFLKMFAGG